MKVRQMQERVFQKMLESGCPPDDWHDLLKEAKGETNRLAAIYPEIL